VGQEKGTCLTSGPAWTKGGVKNLRDNPRIVAGGPSQVIFDPEKDSRVRHNFKAGVPGASSGGGQVVRGGKFAILRRRAFLRL